MKLRDKIIDPQQPVIFYELLPPMLGKDTAYLNAIVDCTTDLVSGCDIHVDAINIPEIHQEAGHHGYKHHTEPKMSPGEFTVILQQAFHHHMAFVLNRGAVYADQAAQLQWLAQIHRQYGIEDIILVGGESSQVSYPGPSVTAMSQLIQQHFANIFCCGGITIPTRRHSDPKRDEPQRLVSKSAAGIDFFTSQVLCEAQNTISLLRDYDKLCIARQVTPKRILLSFAPVTLQRDIDFLRWLGVDIPHAAERRLLQADIGIGWRSIKMAKEILLEIMEFVDKEAIQVPLGLNIEHISRHNFELSKEFISQLGNIYTHRG